VKQVLQPLAGGPVQVAEVPRPAPGPAEVLVRTLVSVISPGTERAVTSLAQASLLAKARARPDLVRQLASRARADGVPATVRAVRGRLAEDLPLGYSAAGIVVSAGPAVAGIRPGQLVATGGAGRASHAEFQAVPGLLCAPVPDGVSAADAAFTTIASIALHALRLAEAGTGAKIVIIGLGLIGQLAARLAAASGCDVAGIDPSRAARDAAARSGVTIALDERGLATTSQVLDWSRGRGADAVLVCAADPSPATMTRTPQLCRDRAAVVVVGDVGLGLRRTPFYERELSLRFARSYGPGRYDRSYEEWGVDYPAGQVRWTEGRNFEAVLDLLAAGRLRVADLVTHTFTIGQAGQAYQLIDRGDDPYLAIQLGYPDGVAGSLAGRPAATDPAASGEAAAPAADPPVRLRPPGQHGGPGVGWIGAGAFSTGTLMPAFRAAGLRNLIAVTSARGHSARRAGQQHGFELAVSGAGAVIAAPGVRLVVVATPHDSHQELTASALAAGQHVWCEKPLALTRDGVAAVEAAWRSSGRQLMIGFNRRWSPAVQAARQLLAGITAPKLITYRIAAGPVPDGHWYRDRRQGGRLLGEVCHFIDTAQALIGADIEEASSLPNASGPGVLAGDDVIVSLRFAGGSLAAIGYGSAAPGAGKERIEVAAGPHRVVIDDFRSATADGRKLWRGRQDKGHRAQAAAFLRAVTGGPAAPTGVMLASTLATIQAAEVARRRD
jgi:hypothetical protein